MKRLSALCLVFFVITATAMTFGMGTISDSLAEGCFVQGNAECFSAANLHWVRPCTGPEQFKADSKGCLDWALMRSNIGSRASISGKPLFKDVSENAQVKGSYVFCMQSRGYSLVALNQVSRNCWNNAPMVPERSRCGCSICGKYTLSHDGRAQVVQTMPENIPLPQSAKGPWD